MKKNIKNIVLGSTLGSATLATAIATPIAINKNKKDEVGVVKTITSTRQLNEYIKSGVKLEEVSITLPAADNTFDFTAAGGTFASDVDVSHTHFKDMDMSNIVVNDQDSVLEHAIFENVTGLQHLIDSLSAYMQEFRFSNFIGISESLDFSNTIIVDNATFQDMDMSHVKTMDGLYSFTTTTFIRVKNLDLTNKEFDDASFTDVNGAIGSDTSKIKGHPSYTGS